MLSKTQISDTVENLSENVSLDELIDKFIFIEKVNIGMGQSEKGMINSEEEVSKKLAQWLTVHHSARLLLNNPDLSDIL